MNSFNNIIKVKYEKSQKDLVSLVEYIIFEDERNKEKYLVFKFQNNVNQYLNEIKFEISQYDQDNNLISKSIISHGAFVAKENEVFVPNCKLKADNDCVKIQAKLLLARFERVVWENGAYTPIPYTASEFRNDYYRPVPDKPVKSKKLIKAEQKVEYKQFKKLQKEFKKRKNLVVKSIIARNKTKFPTVLVTILSVLLLALVGVMTYTESQKSNVYFDGEYDYQVESNGVYISDYEGNDDVVILPLTYTLGEKELPIVGIADNAFKNTSISTIVFQAPVSIGDNAFENCKKLVAINGASNVTSIGLNAFKNCKSLASVKFENVSLVSSGAFEDCKNLVSAIVPNATLEYGSFAGAKKLLNLDCKMIAHNGSLNSIFGEEKDFTDYKIKNVTISQVIVPANFTEGLRTITNIEFTASNPKIEFGALSGASIPNYSNNGSIEIFNGKILSIKDKENVIIPNGIDLDEAFKLLHTFANTIKTLTIDYSGTTQVTSEHLAPLYNLNSIRFGRNTKYSSNVLSNNHSITEVGLSLDNSCSRGLVLPSSVNTLVVHNTTSISESSFNSLSNLFTIKNLKIEDSVNGYYGSVFNGFTNLSSLTLPNFFSSNSSYQVQLNSLGVSYNLRELVITKLEGRNNIKLLIDGYYNLYKVDITESEVKSLGLTISNCYQLREFVVPNTVTTISNILVQYCSITKLVLPSSITGIQTTLVGHGCDNLKYVEVPFVGNNANKISKYYEFNLSYKATEELIITNEMKGNTNLFLSSCNNIKSLQINGQVSSVKNLFGNGDVKLSQLVISTASIDDKTFEGVSINKLYIVEVAGIKPAALASIEDCNLIYLPSTEIAASVDFKALFQNTTPTVYINGETPNNALEYSKYIKENVEFEKIIKYLYKTIEKENN